MGVYVHFLCRQIRLDHGAGLLGFARFTTESARSRRTSYKKRDRKQRGTGRRIRFDPYSGALAATKRQHGYRNVTREVAGQIGTSQ